MEPTTAAWRQVDWLADASTRVPLPDADIRAHMAPELLAASGGPGGLNSALRELGRITVGRTVASPRPEVVQALVSTGTGPHLLTVHVDEAGRVDRLALSAERPPPGSWEELDGPLRELGTRVSFVAAEVDPRGACRVAHGIGADRQRPVGSAFKIYVLGALARAVHDGRAAWDEPMAIRDEWKSLPSGRLQDRPAGDVLTLAEFAEHMISISDNTATDHLIHRLGRDAVQRQLTEFGHARPAGTLPLLSTRAMFRLRTVRYPALAEEYLALPSQVERTAALEDLERLPVPDVTATWPRPRDIDRIGWFASPIDIAHALAGLYRFDRPEIDRALSRNDDGLNLDMSRFPTVWFKGGSEPGVVTLNYLACTADGRVLIVSLMVSDPAAAPAVAEVLRRGSAAVRGAFHLLDVTSR